MALVFKRKLSHPSHERKADTLSPFSLSDKQFFELELTSMLGLRINQRVCLGDSSKPYYVSAWLCGNDKLVCWYRRHQVLHCVLMDQFARRGYSGVVEGIDLAQQVDQTLTLLRLDKSDFHWFVKPNGV